MPDMLDSCNADMIFFAGDMIDFCSKANTETLREGLEALKTPYCYVKADHDMCPYYLTDYNDADCYARQNDISVNSDAWYVDMGEFVILCYNRSDKAMTEDGLQAVNEAIDLGKPLILLTHVPFNSTIDTSLDEKSREVFSDKNLTWGPGYTTAYSAMEGAGDEFLKIVYSADSPIDEVIAGHLHFSWEGQITESVGQHIFDAAFKGKIGYITISGTN